MCKKKAIQARLKAERKRGSSSGGDFGSSSSSGGSKSSSSNKSAEASVPNRGRWTEEEDAAIVRGAAGRQWAAIARDLRTCRAVARRWRADGKMCCGRGSAA